MIKKNNKKQDTEQFEYKLIKEVIDRAGPRLPGSEEEREGAKIIAKRLEEITGNKSEIENFTCHPNASIGSIPILGFILLFISTPLFYFLPIAVVILNILVLLFAILQIFKYTGKLDFLFPKRESCNVINYLEPTGGSLSQTESDKKDLTIIFSAHIDSSWNWNLALKNPERMWIKIPYGILGGVIQTILAIILFLKRNGLIGFNVDFVFYFNLLLIPGFVYLSKFLTWNKEVASPGAMDNLSGVAHILKMAKIIKENPDLTGNIAKVYFVGFGSEEASLKGSEYFVEKHKNDILKDKDRVFVINYDSLVDDDNFYVVNGDVWLGVNYDENLCRLALDSIKETGARPALSMKNPVGGTDAASFSKRGYKAITMIAQDPRASTYYHTKNDNPSVLDSGVFDKMAEISKRLIKKIIVSGV